MAEYAHPEALVSTDWVSQHSGDPTVRVVEVDVDTKAYNEAHVPGAIAWAWNTQLCDTVRRDILSQQQFEALMSASGVTPDTTLVIYGDNNNWFAAWAFWQAKIYGHKDVRLMNGGRKKWLAEGRDVSTDKPQVAATEYHAQAADLSLRAFRRNLRARSWRLRDCPKHASAAATSPARAAFRGARLAMTTAVSRPPTSCARSTATKASTVPSRSSPTAGSASAPATPGSC